jgi:hypothetical protein
LVTAEKYRVNLIRAYDNFPDRRTLEVGMPRVTVRLLVAVCLLAPFVALLGVPWYARHGPVLWGVPFFYWYQLIWIPLTVVLMTVAHRLSRPMHTWEDHRDHHDQ